MGGVCQSKSKVKSGATAAAGAAKKQKTYQLDVLTEHDARVGRLGLGTVCRAHG